MSNYLEEVRNNFLKKENLLCEFATKSSDFLRVMKEVEDIRPPFFHDVDRIIHSLSYTRYIDKTQVYPLSSNDHVSRRMVHVQLVSKIARTIGRALNLNEDLIEAIALGHDIGHTPLGHVGEAILNDISRRELGEYFAHNIQGVRNYLIVENNGKGLNLTIQVLDGIMCHNGEILSSKYVPMKKSKKEFFREYELAYKDLEGSTRYAPMTLEGCVVRISDIIGYIGRDIEDAIVLGRFKREDLDREITRVLGDNNRDIVNTVILDIIKNSLNKPYIKMSDDVYKALISLKEFNYSHIYKFSMTDEKKEYYTRGMNILFNSYLEAIMNNYQDNIIFSIFLNYQSKEYLDSTEPKRMVIDFIAGMTDDLLDREIKRIIVLSK